MENESKFEGGLLMFLCVTFGAVIITLFTFGIAYPWAYCLQRGWIINNTIVDGRKLKFEGTGLGLFGNWIKWWFFSMITLGIYSLWLPIKLQQWEVKNTHFVN